MGPFTGNQAACGCTVDTIAVRVYGTHFLAIKASLILLALLVINSARIVIADLKRAPLGVRKSGV